MVKRIQDCKSVLFALAVVALPILEVYFLRKFLHYGFGPGNSVIGFHFTDTYLPLLLGFVLGLEFLHRLQAIPTRLQLKWACLNILLFVASGLYIRCFDSLYPFLQAECSVAVLLSLFVGCVSCSFFVLMEPSAFIRRLRLGGHRLWWLVAAVAMLFTHSSTIEMAWPYVVSPLGHSLRWLMQLLGFGISQLNIAQNIGIHHPVLNVSIGMPCSGMLGVIFFFFAYFLFLFFAEKPPTVTRWVTMMGLGVFLMTVANLTRILLFIRLGILINVHSPVKYGRPFVLWAFHEHIGWLLYLAALYIFFTIEGRYRKSPAILPSCAA